MDPIKSSFLVRVNSVYKTKLEATGSAEDAKDRSEAGCGRYVSKLQ